MDTTSLPETREEVMKKPELLQVLCHLPDRVEALCADSTGNPVSPLPLPVLDGTVARRPKDTNNRESPAVNNFTSLQITAS